MSEAGVTYSAPTTLWNAEWEAVAVIGERPLGIDVSQWQGKMDWAKAKAAGARFAFIRACNGLNADDQLERNVGEAPQHLPIGFYAALQPGLDVIEQADFFSDLIEDTPYTFSPWLDVEIDGGKTPAQLTSIIKQHVRRVFDNLGDSEDIYTRALWWNTHTAADPLFGTLGLAIARYALLDHPWGDGTCVPRDWDDWEWWQWSADGNHRGAEFGAESDSIDLDYHNGPLSPGYPYLVQVVAENNTPIRGYPGGGKLWGAAMNGDLVGVEERAEAADGKAWVRIGLARWIKEDHVRRIA